MIVPRNTVFHRARFRGSILVLVSVVALALLMTLLAPGTPDARVKGRCRDCHEMHGKDSSPGMTRDCLGCHAVNPAGTKSIIQSGKVRTPQVIHRMDGGDLAAGNFAYVTDVFNVDDFRHGHNIAGLAKPELPPMDQPPGFEGNIPIPGGVGPSVWPVQQQINCAGTWGCHGDRMIEDPYKAMSGAHHENDKVLDGSTVGRSYRFLLGVKGVEHKEWEFMATVDDHNGYKGDIAHTNMDTISYFCAECHSKFHPNPYLGGIREVGAAYYSAWVRHPADISFSAMHTQYAGSEYQDFTRYSLEVPVGFHDPTGKEDTVDINSIVICVSCHRAHASPQASTLRWDYDRMLSRPGTSGTGCLTCHTRKGGMGGGS